MSSVPKWQVDSAASKCYLCKAHFTLFNRRHHCRKCGQLVCASCSAQQVRYFANSYVLNPQNTPQRARSHTYYKTCDVCVDEIRMIRETLVNATEPPPVPPGGSSDFSTSGSSSNVSSVPAGEPTKAVDLVKQPQRAKTGDDNNDSRHFHSDAESDADLCPVCGVDLWKQFSSEISAKNASKAEVETYKESHINQCLVSYDFTNENLRLSSPPGGSHARNRMLVYNIPPIPEPSYETIQGNSPSSISTLSRDGGVSGSTPSNTTFMGSEKDAIDAECVICLEELRPGDKVGRLECLCVFHYKCIKDWFNKKSFAECPVHFLHS